MKRALLDLVAELEPSLLIGGAALFFYGKPQRSLDYDFWVRTQKDKLVQLLENHGFEVDSKGPAMVVAYLDEIKVDFFLGRQFINRDGERIIFDEIAARGKLIQLADASILIPCIEDMIKMKKLGDQERPKDVEDIAFLKTLMDKLTT